MCACVYFFLVIRNSAGCMVILTTCRLQLRELFNDHTMHFHAWLFTIRFRIGLAIYHA